MSKVSYQRAVEPIVACCTAAGAAALALIRVSGEGAIALVAQAAQLTGKAVLTQVANRSISYGYLIDHDGAHLDQVLFLVMSGPATFTGHDTVEITCHNNRFVIEAIIARLCQLGARQARPGEFTQRAVENNKLDLLQAEALHELIMAPSRALAQTSLAQLEGSLSHTMSTIEADLTSLAALVEASFEFSEEEHIDLDFDAVVKQRLVAMATQIKDILAGQNSVQHLRDGIRIALVGMVNAGKSTLLNTLLGRKRAIVSDQAGTTRDSIEASMSSGGYSWTFIDTAGLRETNDIIEQEGIVRAHEAAQGADLVLLVLDASSPLDEATIEQYQAIATRYTGKVAIVQSKIDLGCQQGVFRDGAPQFAVSSSSRDGIDQLEQFIQERVSQLYSAAQTPFVLNQRHIALLTDLHKKLSSIESEYTNEIQYEIMAAQLHEALMLLVELTGRGITEQVMDSVFSTFCIGK